MSDKVLFRMNENILKKSHNHVNKSDLGKVTAYPSSYNPKLLYAISRTIKRQELGLDVYLRLPFFGFDAWNHYEVSWLNEKGKPMVAIGKIVYDCHSPQIIESKSLKLYFNSLNNTKFKSMHQLEKIIKKDLETAVGMEVYVSLQSVSGNENDLHLSFQGENLDDLDVECSVYLVEPSFLRVGTKTVEETLYSDLLKSNCPVTNQPDWGSIQITYKGKQIDREGLLKYIVSFRHYNEFHEQCVERIFMDLMSHCQPLTLAVYGRYTRRGGLDINPYRSTDPVLFKAKNYRLVRQ